MHKPTKYLKPLFTVSLLAVSVNSAHAVQPSQWEEIPYRFFDIGVAQKATLDTSGDDPKMGTGFYASAGIGSFFGRYTHVEFDFSYRSNPMEGDFMLDGHRMRRITATNIFLNGGGQIPIGPFAAFATAGFGYGKVSIEDKSGDHGDDDSGLTTQLKLGVRYHSRQNGIWGIYWSQTHYDGYKFGSQKYDIAPSAITLSIQF